VALLAALLLLLLPTLPAAAQEAGETVDLTPGFVEGQATRYSMWSRWEQQSTLRFGPSSQQTTGQVHSEGELVWTVVQVHGDGGATCELAYDWLRLTFESEGEEAVADTRRGPGDAALIHAFLEALVDHPIRYRLAADGEVESVQGADALRRAMEVEQMHPEDRDLIESAVEAAYLPGAPAELSVGGSWDRRYTWSIEDALPEVPTVANERWTYTLSDTGELAGVPVATIDAEADLRLQVQPDADLPEGVGPIRLANARGEATEQIIFDLDRGEVASRHMTGSLGYTASVTLPNGITLQRESRQSRVEQLLRLGAE
jgi:hypothetical protein